MKKITLSSILSLPKKLREKKTVAKKYQEYVVVLCIYDERNRMMFSCSDPENGKIKIELMHLTSDRKMRKQEDMNAMALKTFNSYLNPLSELNVEEFGFKEIEIEDMLCHLIYIPNSRVRIMAYNKPHCLLDITGFKNNNIQSKSDLGIDIIKVITKLAFANSPVVKTGELKLN